MAEFPHMVRYGFTLIELILVVMVLAILAGVVVPLVNGISQISTPGGPKSDRRIVTETTMLTIRDTFLSTGSRTGIWADSGHQPNRLPRTIGQICDSDPPTGTTPPFDPVTKIGWRGPYLTQWSGTCPDYEGGDKNPLTGNLWNTDGFSYIYGNPLDPAVIDAWGTPIVLQIDFDGDSSITADEARAARLVSAGPNGKIDWDLDINNTEQDYQVASNNDSIDLDDVVIYLGIVQ